MNWIPGFCLLAGITLVAAVWWVIDKWASRYLQGHLDRIEEQSTNVTALDSYRRGDAKVIRIDSKRTGGVA